MNFDLQSYKYGKALATKVGCNVVLSPEERGIMDVLDTIFDDVDIQSADFLNGYFEKIGHLQDFGSDSNFVCFFKKHEHVLKLLDMISINYEIDGDFIFIQSYNALDFLDIIYKNQKRINTNDEKYLKFIKWVTFDLQKNIPTCSFYSVLPDAVIPTKSRASDVGYDLTIIKKVKDIGSKTALYDTGIAVAPEFGYYTKIVPRSSIIKSGYMLTNSTGIIDGTYRGNLMICLTKIDDTMPDLTLPFKCCQLILDRSLHYKMKQVYDVNDLGNTNRGTGGFGSTNK